MKKMSVYFLILSLALAICGWLARRQERSMSVPAGTQAMDHLQGEIRLDRDGAYSSEAAKRRLKEKLQEQERIQRPQEGRN